MDNDLQRCYQRNCKIGMVSMVIVTLVFALWVYSLEVPSADVQVYKGRSFDPFAKKFCIEGRGESGNKIGISQSIIAQNVASSVGNTGSQPIAGANHVWPHSKVSAPSNFESRLMDALKTHITNHDLVILPPERPDTIEVYGYILEGPGGAFFMIDSIRPDNELFREKVERILEKEKVFVSPTQAPYTVLFVRGEED